MLEREEYVEQTYLFRILRDRLLLGLSTQELLDGVKELHAVPNGHCVGGRKRPHAVRLPRGLGDSGT